MSWREAWRIVTFFLKNHFLLFNTFALDSLSGNVTFIAILFGWIKPSPSSTLSNSQNIHPILFFSLAVIRSCSLSLSHFLSHSLVIHFSSPPRAARPLYDTNYFILEHTAQPTHFLYTLTLTRTLYVPVPIIFVLFLCNFKTFSPTILRKKVRITRCKTITLNFYP